MYEYAGNIHIHSRYSDGSGSIPEIARAAEKAGLDFIIINDHHHLKGKPEEGYYGKVMVLVGSEFNEQRNHYLGIDIKEPVPANDDNPQEVIDGVRDQGGIGFIAHPFEKGSPIYENGKIYPWTDWQVSGFTGIDIWSFLSQWKDEITGLPTGIYLYFNPHQAFKKGPPGVVLQKWDELLRERMVVGIGCSDAHAIKLRMGLWQPVVSGYYQCFRCINTHVILKEPLSGEFEQDKTSVYQALRMGNCFVGYDFFKNARGFRFVANSSGRPVNMGERTRAQGTILQVNTPFRAKVVLRKDGKDCLESVGKRHRFARLSPGIYRAEAYHRHGLGYRAWIFSNPIYLD